MHSRLPRLLAVALFAMPSLLRTQSTTLPFDFSSVLYGNFNMRIDSAAKALTGGKPLSRFDLTRAYLNFRFPVGDKASVRVTTDVFQQLNAPANAFYGGLAIRLKYGYFQYEATKNLAGIDGLVALARVGMLQTVVIEHIETFWPRWLGNSAVEQSGFFSSADLGVSGLFTFPKRIGEAYVTITNGPGYAVAESDRFKDFAARVSLTPFGNDSSFLRTFTITPWFYKGWSGSAYTQATPAISEGLQKDRAGIFVGLRDRRVTIGAEYDQRFEDLETTAPPVVRGPLNDRTSQLFSGFAVVRPVELFDPKKRSRFSLIGRYDRLKLDDDLDPYLEFLVAGAIWELTPKVWLALDYQGFSPRDNPVGVPLKTWFLHWTANF